MPVLLEKVHFLCWRRSLVGALLTPLGTSKFVRLWAHPNTLDETASHPYSTSFSSTSRGVLVDMESSSPAGDLSIRALHLTVSQVTSERTAWEGFSSVQAAHSQSPTREHGLLILDCLDLSLAPLLTFSVLFFTRKIGLIIVSSS